MPIKLQVPFLREREIESYLPVAWPINYRLDLSGGSLKNYGERVLADTRRHSRRKFLVKTDILKMFSTHTSHHSEHIFLPRGIQKQFVFYIKKNKKNEKKN